FVPRPLGCLDRVRVEVYLERAPRLESRSISRQDIRKRNHPLKPMEIGAVDNGEERPVADLPQRHVDWLVRMQARQASSGNDTLEGQGPPPFLCLTTQSFLGDGAPLAVRETDQEILRRRGIGPLEGP